jgi:hypothetical protein
VWHCDDGYLVSSSYNVLIAYGHNGVELQRFDGGGEHQHFENFVAAARAGDPSMLNAECAEGHISSGLCQLGNISYRLGAEAGRGEARPLSSEAAPFGDDEAGNEAWGRMSTHLSENGVDGSAAYTVGPVLTFDPGTERFWGSDAKAAEELATGSHRSGYRFDRNA